MSESSINKVSIRNPRPGDGEGMARAWFDAGVYYAGRQPDLFQVTETEGLAATPESWALNASADNVWLLVAEVDEQTDRFVQAVVEQPLANAAQCFVMRDLMERPGGCSVDR